MSPSESEPEVPIGPVRPVLFVAVIMLTVIAGLIAISNQSLWIDEANTAQKALRPTFADWSHLMLTERKSDVQMPLYMLYMWAWEKTVGARPEWLFRLSNLPWLVLAQAAMFLSLRHQRKLSIFLAILVCIHPFVWFYMNEARPYIMQFAGASFVASFFARLLSGNESNISLKWYVVFGVGIVLLSGSSMLGTLWAGSAFMLLFCFWKQKRLRVTEKELFMLVMTLILLFPLGIYFLHSLLTQHAAPTGGETGLPNIAFSFYELLGFAGMGPARDAIRMNGITAFKPWLSQLAVFSVVLLPVILISLKTISRRNAIVCSLLFASISFPAILVFLLGILSHARVLGRHFTPILPGTLFLTASGLNLLWTKKSGKSLVILFFVLNLASATSLRFASRHAKDDNREGVQIVSDALNHGMTVWWVGDEQAATYYRLPFANPKVTLLRSPVPHILDTLFTPDLVVLARPDAFDDKGAIRARIRSGGYKQVNAVPGLTFWAK